MVVGPTDRRSVKTHCRKTTITSGAFGRQNHPSSHSVTNGYIFTGAAKTPTLCFVPSDAQNVVSDLPLLTNPTRQPSSFDAPSRCPYPLTVDVDARTAVPFNGPGAPSP